MEKIDHIDEAILKDLFDDLDDDEGFTAAERIPVALASLLNDELHPEETINKKRYRRVKGFSKTRWHSILLMLESLGSQRAAVNRIIPTLENALPITIGEWELINELIRFLKLFRTAVETFSSEKKTTLSSALIFRIEIEATLAVDKKDHYLIAELKEKLLAQLDYRFPITKEILIGALLDPRLHHLPRLQAELSKRNTTKFEFLKEEILKIVENVNTKPNSPKGQPSAAKKKKLPSMLEKLIDKHAYESTSPTTTNQDHKIDEEIHKYFLTIIPRESVEDFNVLAFWKDHRNSLPLMCELVKKFLCIPVTSTSSERAFSYAGILISAKRSCLGPFVVEKTLFIHDNYDLVKKTIFGNI